MAAYSFLGTGMKFPPQIDPATGRFATSSDAESIKESVYLILMTQQTERITRPEFGSTLLSYTFVDMTHTSISMLVYSLRELLIHQEPRISDVEITTENHAKSGVLLVNVDYVISRTNTRDNLVFPFYLNAINEEEEGESEFYEPEDNRDDV
ncbi:MAG: GPW/gp25 family protein [Lachnospiraceae bacterium]|nr:GPW/gp25 family protein [Lachnospiraceae bacterium]